MQKKKTISITKEVKGKKRKTTPKKKASLREKKPRPSAKKTSVEPEKNKQKYFEAVGRRKTATARVRLFTQGEKNIIINEKPYDVYFPTKELQFIVSSPLEVINSLGKFGIKVKVKGGGIHAQAEAARHALARALEKLNPYFHKRLKKAGFLTRDARMRERKKFGLKRARRAPQWSKR